MYSCSALWSSKASAGDGIPAELFQILKDDAVKGLHSVCQQIWKTQPSTQDWKRLLFIQISKKGNVKECSNYHTIQKTKIMASSPFTSWHIDGETAETVADFVFLGSKITADGDCSNEIRIHLLLGRKVMTNLDSIFKSRDITLPTKVHLVKAMVFPVVMYGCESWTIKKADR